MKIVFFIICFIIVTEQSCITLQNPDKRYDVNIDTPPFNREFSKVLYDEAHLNTHKANGTYKPFIDLITNDGYKVSVNREKFSIKKLQNFDLLIICNAKSDKHLPRDIGAFTKEECVIVNEWVKDGGSLLLIADHHPFGLANKSLALTFGVEMGCGSVSDPSNSNKKQKGQLEFSSTNRLLQEHPIIEGYKTNEIVNKVITFTGQSLKGEGETKSLLNFGKNAVEVRPDSIWSIEDKNYITFAKPISVADLSQAIAIDYNNGKVVILGEAAMITAQKLFGRKFGMNFPKDSDNKQFALNVVHWLTKNGQ